MENKIDKLKEELIEIVREDLSTKEFVDFAVEWLGEDGIMDMIKDSIEGYPIGENEEENKEVIEFFEKIIKGLKNGVEEEDKTF